MYSPDPAVPNHTSGLRPTGVTENDLIDFTPELRAQAIQNLAQFQNGPMSIRHCKQGRRPARGPYDRNAKRRNELAGCRVRPGDPYRVFARFKCGRLPARIGRTSGNLHVGHQVRVR